VLVPGRQRLALPRGSYDRLCVLAAAVGGDVRATFTIAGSSGARPMRVLVRDWQGPVGQWDSVLKDAHLFQEVFVPAMRGQSWIPETIQADMVVRWDPATGAVGSLDQIRPGFVKRDEIAWVGGHRHSPDGNQPYIPTYLFAYAIDLPAGAREFELPNEPRLRILAATLARGPSRIRPAHILYAPDLPDR